MEENILQDKINIIEQDTKNKLLRDFPTLYWDGIITVDTPRVRLAVDDISYRASSPLEDDIATFQLACKGWLETYDIRDLANRLAGKLTTFLRAVDKKKTVVILPGDGARVIKDLFPEELLDEIALVEIPAKRKVTQNGFIDGVEIGGKTAVREVITQRKAETILIVDDVVVTGSTLSAIRQAFPMRNLEWFGASLMMLSPLQRKVKPKNESGVEGYKSIISPIVYQGLAGIPPLNSLSTLIGNSEKCQTVRRKYMQDYVEDEKSFLETVASVLTKINL